MPKGARSIVVVRKPKVDRLSDPSTAPFTGLPIDGVIILPRQTFEQGQGWVTIDGWDIYILPTSRATDEDGPRRYEDGDILPTDMIQIGDRMWQVDGNPAPYDKGTRRKATLIKVKRASTTAAPPAGPLPFTVTEWDGDDLVDLIEAELDG